MSKQKYLTGEQIINNNSLTVAAGEEKMVFKNIALTAVNSARLQEREKAKRAFCYVLKGCIDSGIESCEGCCAYKLFEQTMQEDE